MSSFGSTLVNEEALLRLVSGASACAIMFGGVVPFLPQYKEIRASGNADGFSTYVCLTLLVANIMRICFWFGKHFETPLLVQSVLMIFIMLAMVEICVRTKNKSELIATKPRTLTDPTRKRRLSDPTDLDIADSTDGKPTSYFDPRSFWKWTDFSSYVQFIILFSGVCGGITYLLLHIVIFVETLGFLAVLFEAMLAAPQFYRNFRKKSTLGMSLKMVFFWFVGDVFKTAYFILRVAPPQFWICGTLQVGIDVAIFFQVYYYANARAQHAS